MSTKRGTGSLDTREKILNVSVELFMENGYPGTPLSLIASKLGFSKAALYYHFKNKDDILNGILNPLLDRIDALLEEAPQRFTDAESRWKFLVTYSDLMLSDPRAVSVLAIGGSQVWLPESIYNRIERHRVRTIELTMLPGMSDEEKVRSILLMDMMHRETVFDKRRFVIDGMTPERRREIVYSFIKKSFED
ncbi:TetR/AcrR family transcriptional regulator [Arthrobacter sp. BL-252-APC-1A]|uniref:TetR/AcrR family transcriptional regulator n=1 Tax=Arthrobacter sp. BL-252-APC-1A TaxID=2606622 RepID=UPI0018A6AEC3|nr:TetR/AcrR family transcriptional regulator [Arthrobacter sp. BL-252-APC-1A]